MMFVCGFDFIEVGRSLLFLFSLLYCFMIYIKMRNATSRERREAVMSAPVASLGLVLLPVL